MSDAEKSDAKKTSEGGSGPMEMGMGMAKKMMKQMGGGESGPNSMMRMCKDMLGAVKETTDMAAFATPELRSLFVDWLETVEGEAMRHLQQAGETDVADLAKALNISEESAAYLIAHMTTTGKVRSQVRAAEKTETD